MYAGRSSRVFSRNVPCRGVGTQLANFMLAQVQMCFVCVAQLSNKNHATISKVTASAADLYLGVMRPLSAAEVREINASFPWSTVAMFQVRSECAAPSHCSCKGRDVSV